MNETHARVRATHVLASALGAFVLSIAAQPTVAAEAAQASPVQAAGAATPASQAPAGAAPAAAATATAAPAATAGGPSVVDAASTPTGALVLPPLRFNGSVAGDELYTRLKQDARYAKLDRELVGSPIELRVSQASESTAGGKAAGFASAILAGGTLGLLPVVTNDDLVITYAYTVNGTEVASWSYRKNFTRSQNIYAEDKSYGLGAEALAWVKTTADQFLADSRTDTKLAELVREYEFYFGPVKK